MTTKKKKPASSNSLVSPTGSVNLVPTTGSGSPSQPGQIADPTTFDGSTIPVLDGAGDDPWGLSQLLPAVGPGNAPQTVGERVASVAQMSLAAQQQLGKILAQAGLITTKANYTTSDVQTGLTNGFKYAQESKAGSLSRVLTQRAQQSSTPAASGSVSVEAPPQVTQDVYQPQDIQDTVNAAAQKLVGRNATPDEVSAVAAQLNASAATKAQAQAANDTATQQEDMNTRTDVGAATGGNASAQQVYSEVLNQGGTMQQAQVGAALVSGIESNGSPTELAGGIGPAQGLFQFEPQTWTGSAGGGKNGLPSQVGQATWQQQVTGFINATKGNNFGAWGPDLGANYGYTGAPKSGSKVANWISANSSQLTAAGGGSAAVVGVANGAVGANSIESQGHAVTTGTKSQALGAIATAENQEGTNYVWGGEQPGKGFDCSGLVQWAFGQVGVKLPRVAQDQYNATQKVPLQNIQAGDLVFFGSGPNAVDHVGIYIGNDQMVVAPHTGTKVQVQSGVLQQKNIVGVTQAAPATASPTGGTTPSTTNPIQTIDNSSTVQGTAPSGSGNTDVYQNPVINQVPDEQSPTDAASFYYENQDSPDYQKNNLLNIFSGLKTALTSNSLGSNVNVRDTPLSMAPTSGGVT